MYIAEAEVKPDRKGAADVFCAVKVIRASCIVKNWKRRCVRNWASLPLKGRANERVRRKISGFD